MDAVIYSLSNPITGEIRYVGKTINMSSRLNDHLTDKKRNPKCCWIKSLMSKGIRPAIESLEVIRDSNDNDWQEPERFWIKYLRFLGCRLLNIEEGGNGGKRLAESTRRKLSEAIKGKPGPNKGKKFPPEWCARISAGKKLKKKPSWNKGVPCTEAAKKNLRQKNKGQIGYWTGKKRSPETVAKISASKKRKRQDEIL